MLNPYAAPKRGSGVNRSIQSNQETHYLDIQKEYFIPLEKKKIDGFE